MPDQYLTILKNAKLSDIVRHKMLRDINCLVVLYRY